MQRTLLVNLAPFKFRVLKDVAQYCLLASLWLALTGCGDKRAETASGYVQRPRGAATYSKDIAPIIYNNCSGCHRPGESAPFNLLTYEDARKHAKQIVDVTQRRYMPPWLPDPTVVHFVGERRLSDEQLGLIKQWVAEDSVEGNTNDLPALPKWNTKWALGEPDLVVKPSVPFILGAEGRDVYRNLIVPIPIERRRYVRGLDFKPNNRAVHHAFLRFDRSGDLFALDGKDGKPGFYGLHTPKSAESPITFASWQPGKIPRFYPDDLAWLIETNTVLALQLHLQPTGKDEAIAPEGAFYFTDKPGEAIAFKMPLNSYTIDIPAGKPDYVATDSFVLPVDVEIRGVLPHAHYLCKDMKGYADLPDGSRRWLMSIKEWDFNWQGDYQFPTPLALPKGSKVVMQYTYDNSTNNARNPNQPPQRVRYGMQSMDEMGELWLLTVMKTTNDFVTFQRALRPRFLSDSILANETLLRQNPRDAKAHTEIGTALVMSGKPQEALQRLGIALQIDPNNDEAYYFRGLAYRTLKQLDPARQEFEMALQVNPKHARARGNLGLVLSEQGKLPEAAEQFRIALQLNPDDEIARDMLARIDKTMGIGRGR